MGRGEEEEEEEEEGELGLLRSLPSLEEDLPDPGAPE
jgi:hypothetical protein